ncbi:MAG: hypothetical protein OXT72_09115 [Gammaproteobacteria bacterium]|nr:hypothetical protein [Gammaproteobacteria bacterium]MDE0247528.1 hypothetical protein [Gammaproteobacteria bacterium]
MLNRRKWLRWLLLAAGILWMAGTFSAAPVVDAVTGEVVSDASFRLSPGYLALAPVMGVLDHLSLLTDRQHVAVLLGIAVAYFAVRATGRVLRRSPGKSLAWEAGLGGAVVLAVLAVYAFGVLGMRPMVALESHDPDVVIVDFHSHTDSSHDGRPGFDAGARREWHRSAGFDLAYLSDHDNLDAVAAVQRPNPELAGEGLSFLPGVEVRYRNQHVVVLGEADPNRGIPPGKGWPTLIQTIPNNLSRVPLPTRGKLGGVHAIELVDADPRGLRQSVEERDLILQIADSLDLTPVSGSNHHGWGRTAAAWNLIRVPGWQDLRPDELGAEVEALVRGGPTGRIQIAERRRLRLYAPREPLLAEALTAPRLAVHILRSLTFPERLAWLPWIAACVLVVARRRPRGAG